MAWWQIISTVAAVCSAIVVIYGFGKHLFKGAAETYEKHENIERIPELLEAIQSVSNSLDDFIDKYKEIEDKIEKLTESFKEEQTHREKEKDLLLSVARQILLDEMEKALEAHEEIPERKVVLGELYKHYLGNGGNGTVKNMWEKDYISLPLKTNF